MQVPWGFGVDHTGAWNVTPSAPVRLPSSTHSDTVFISGVFTSCASVVTEAAPRAHSNPHRHSAPIGRNMVPKECGRSSCPWHTTQRMIGELIRPRSHSEQPLWELTRMGQGCVGGGERLGSAVPKPGSKTAPFHGLHSKHIQVS